MLLSAFKLAFFGFLRHGEVTIKSSSELNNAIRINAIMFSANKSSYVLHLSASKSDPYRNGVHIHICQQKVVPCFFYVSVCPNEDLPRSQQVRSFICRFVYFNGVVLTRHQFINNVHHLLCRLGVNTYKYYGHSFWIGAATSTNHRGDL